MKGQTMKLTEASIDSTLHQIEAQAVPENHPVMLQLSQLFGNHTFFLDRGGLAIIEPAKPDGEGSMGQVVRLARWADETHTNLTMQDREYTAVTVALDRAA
jgi:hypothetical protein